jgi:putative membrane protein
MNIIVPLLIFLVVTSISLFLVSKIPFTGVEVDSGAKLIQSVAVFGILNALLLPVLQFFAFPINFLTFGLFNLILNAIIFGLAAKLVVGFRLRNGIWSALIGSVLLSVINSIIFGILPPPPGAPGG